MATIRELQASFVAKASGMKSTIEGVKKDINGLKKSSDNVSSGMSSNLESFGKSMTNFGGGLQKASEKAGKLGKSLTKKITLPALGVATALGGITAALGWKRLVGLDSAQAQLKGLGYSTKEVGRISKQVTKAIDGGMTTMAEGTAVAAGALAAGVKEGAELEKYIKLVGDAAVGANRPVSDMASIFNRVQGMGKMMTEELNMIEDGMPGFAMAMSKNLGVSQEEFRKMVTAGKVSSKDFLTVMDSFAGNMATAYSDSWAGMVANTKAYVGIIGENLLGGVFEKSKESITEFISFLKSDEVVAWAENAGRKIGEMFSIIVDKVKSSIQWFANLSKSQQSLITKFGAIAVAAGPVLLMLASIGGIIGKVSSGIGTLMTSMAKTGGVFGLVSKTAADGTKKVGLLSRAFTLLTGPVGITIGIISALIAGFVIAYKKSETFRNFVDMLKDAFAEAYKKIKEFLTTNKTLIGFIDSIKSGFQTLKGIVSEAINAIVDFFKDKFGEMKAFWDGEGSSFLKAFSNIFSGIWKVTKPVIDKILALVKVSLPIIQKIFSIAFKAVLFIVKEIWENVKGVIDGGLKVIMGLIKVFSGIFTGDFSKMWEGIKQLFVGALQFIWNLFNLMMWGKLVKGALSLGKLLISAFRNMWSSISGIFTKFIGNILKFIRNGFGSMRKRITDIIDTIRLFISYAWDNIVGFTGRFLSNLVKGVLNGFGRLLSGTMKLFGKILKFLVKTWKNILSFSVKTAQSILARVVNGWARLLDNTQAVFSAVWKFLKSTWNTILKFIIKTLQSILARFLNGWSSISAGTRSAFTGIWNFLRNTWNIIVKFIVNTIKTIVNRVVTGFVNIYNRTKEIITAVWKFLRDTWNTIVNFISQMIKIFVNHVITGFVNIYNRTKAIFTAIWNFLRKIWTTVFNFIVNTVKNIVNRFISGWNNLFNNTQSIFTRIWNFLKNLWDTITSFIINTIKTILNRFVTGWQNLYNNTKRIFTNTWNFIKSIWTTVKDFISKTVGSIFSTVRNTWDNLWGNTKRIFKGIYNTVKGYFDDIVTYAKGLPKKIGDGVAAMADKVVAGIVVMANKMIGGVEGAVNKVIDGINWVLGKLGVDDEDQLDPASFKRYAHGTKGSGHPEDGPAWVGDGRGSNAGSELIQTPDDTLYLSPEKDTLVNMPKGTHVWSAKDTKSMLEGVPAYAKGTKKKKFDWKKGLLGNTKWGNKANDRVKDTMKKNKELATKAVAHGIDWYSDPAGKLLKEALKVLGYTREKVSKDDWWKSMASGAWGKVFDGGKGKISKEQKEAVPEAPAAGSSASAWRPLIQKAAARMKESVTSAQINGIIAQIQRESGGNEKIVQSSAVWDVNTAAGNPARGLLQYIPQTFGAYKVPGHGNIYSGYDQLLAFFNNKNWRNDLPYGKRGWGPRGARKYADGGIVDTKQLAWIADGGWAESIISHDPAKKVRQQRIWQKTGDTLGFTNEKENKKPNEFTQNLTINSPKALSPSEISRKNLQSLRRMAIEWGL